MVSWSSQRLKSIKNGAGDFITAPVNAKPLQLICMDWRAWNAVESPRYTLQIISASHPDTLAVPTQFQVRPPDKVPSFIHTAIPAPGYGTQPPNLHQMQKRL